jgi:hypothetical protein
MAEPSAKKAINASKIGFRPKVEARPPMVGRIAVEAMVYALPTQMKSEPWRWPTMVGNAVETAV